MSLSDIQNKLYKKEEETGLASHDTSEYDLNVSSGKLSPEEPDTDLWAEKKLELADEKKKKALKIGAYALGGIILAIILVVGAYVINKALFNQSQVTVSLAGPASAKSGDLISYDINFADNNYTSLKNASLEVTFPEDFHPEGDDSFKLDSNTSGSFPVGNIDAHGKGKITFSGRMYSPNGALIYLKADLKYQKGDSQYVASNQMGININASPVTVEVLGPQNVSSGDQVNYVISYQNNSQASFDNIVVRAGYPDGFTFTNSDPKSQEDNDNWYIGHLSAGQEGKITVSGELAGGKDQIKTITADVGTSQNGNFVSMSQQETQTNIIASPFNIAQTVNGVSSLSVSAGDGLSFNVNFKNASATGMSNVLVTEKLDSPVLDYSTLDTGGKGYYDDSTKTITWKASDYPFLANLGPGQSGAINFFIKVKDVIPVASANDKNFVVSSVARIDSPDVPTPVGGNKIISGNEMDMKLNSKLVLDVKGYYNDGKIPNSGPLPPKVNQVTTYTLHFLITDVSNDVTGATVNAVLPSGVVATGKVYPDGANITYNARTNSISWDVGNVSAGTGILSAPLEAAFQVAIKPSVNMVNQDVKLLTAPTLTATDAFTGQNLSFTGDDKTTNLMEDPQAGNNKSVVP